MYHHTPFFILLLMTSILIIMSSFISLRRGVGVMGFSSSSFLPSTSSRRLISSTRCSIVTRGIKQRRTPSSLLKSGSRSTLIMWGEEDAPNKRQQRPVIPTSNFSSESESSNNNSRRMQRPPRRRSNQNNNNQEVAKSDNGWFDNDNDNDDDDVYYNEKSNNKSSAYRRNTDRPTRRGTSNTSSRDNNGGGWDVDFNDNGNDWSSNYEPYTYDKGSGGGSYNRRGEGRGRNARGRNSRGGGGGRSEFKRQGRGSGRGGRSSSGGRGGRGRGRGRGRGNDTTDNNGAVRINLKLIEAAGFQHLYGIAPVLNALKMNLRDFSNPDLKESEELAELQNRLNEALDGQQQIDATANNDGWDVDYVDEEDDESNNNNTKDKKKRIIKPEAQTSPHLFIQEGNPLFDDTNNKRNFRRSNAKVEASSEILTLAKNHKLPIVEVDKGILNTLCGNRPHQGFVLRCGGRDFEPMKRLPLPPLAGKKKGPKLWLALDEVVDPQNLGALLRSSYFLGRGAATIDDPDIVGGGGGEVGILVCSKNSSPLTPTVSAASAGALEFMTIYSTSNLPRLLNHAKEDGWRILGAAAETSETVTRDSSSSRNGELALGLDDAGWDLGEDDGEEAAASVVVGEEADTMKDVEQQYFELHKVDADTPTILVLGSEGRGLRTLVARSCTGFVSIPGGIGAAGSTSIEDDESEEKTQAGVDSLNVSVTGGIMLWHLLSKQM